MQRALYRSVTMSVEIAVPADVADRLVQAVERKEEQMRDMLFMTMDDYTNKYHPPIQPLRVRILSYLKRLKGVL